MISLTNLTKKNYPDVKKIDPKSSFISDPCKAICDSIFLYEKSLLLIITYNNKPVGLILSCEVKFPQDNKKHRLIIKFMIDYNSQSLGIGSEALSKFIKIDKKFFNTKEIYVSIERANTSAKRFYLKNGFTESKFTDEVLVILL